MNAILVSVEYGDILALTLPRNRHHFKRVMVVTSRQDDETVAVAHANDAEVYQTNAFYDRGAVFNKWAALEEGLDVLGRCGWLCVMDADIVWPKEIALRGAGHPDCEGGDDCWCEPFGNPVTAKFSVHCGQLLTPLRHDFDEFSGFVPPESEWGKIKLHSNQNEWAGYTQIFHADDPHLGTPPWHQVDWTHAGGADSFFQRKWPAECKVRPPWKCLHLGPPGLNWMGRATARLDGTTPELSAERRRAVEEIWRGRARNRLEGSDVFEGEKI